MLPNLLMSTNKKTCLSYFNTHNIFYTLVWESKK